MFGVLSVLILTRIARRMFRSTVLGCAAGLLMALDGMHFVLSRTAILDIFVMFFVLAAFACLVLDRDHRRAALAARAWRTGSTRPRRAGPAGPRCGWAAVPWWRLAAGVMLGAGCGGQVERRSSSSRSSLLLIYFWEVGLRKTVGAAAPVARRAARRGRLDPRHGRARGR